MSPGQRHYFSRSLENESYYRYLGLEPRALLWAINGLDVGVVEHLLSTVDDAVDLAPKSRGRVRAGVHVWGAGAQTSAQWTVLQHILFIVGCDSRNKAIIYSKRKIVRGSTFITRRAGK
jgi:hypothetical protein